MFYYFGYGSNMNLISLRAKGVDPIHSQKAILRGWKLTFNVQHWFRHEGGMGNIARSSNEDDLVEGVVHLCHDDQLASMDAMESFGVAYDRVEVQLETASGIVKAFAYIGMPDYLDNSCLPTRRYLNILLKGARAAELSESYIYNLSSHSLLPEIVYPVFEAPAGNFPIYTSETLAQYKHLTALLGAVFDMSKARPKLKVIEGLFGGKDMTLFHLKRHDTSTGTETLEEVKLGRISKPVQHYLNAYLNEYNKEFNYAGRYLYDPA
ncbi:gamma-glutamylcyclotransferase family protein [Algoriphagus sp.]|uniref:gamma-glutamylcyclotransferase family protein n=1 Tax=Algoriphagus sp. TaxID=1872435 RepID=UPI0027222A9C|nr:gamma-glutamylcyclotransferase [Algoriphagus sp.]MDO8965214.1 gamma-glutamylcyclotransferase [Algoriphagus sp.]MDP3199005.1 gamma-glutamylcyclotransferase [Algoriphagus sp.]